MEVAPAVEKERRMSSVDVGNAWAAEFGLAPDPTFEENKAKAAKVDAAERMEERRVKLGVGTLSSFGGDDEEEEEEEEEEDGADEDGASAATPDEGGTNAATPDPAEVVAAIAPEVAALFAAAKAGDVVQIDALLPTVADGVDALGPHGGTALLTALHHGNVDVAALLLDKGADANWVSAGGQMSPLSVAACAGNLAAVEQLLARGAKVDTATKWGWTALHFACTKGALDVALALIAASAPIDGVTRDDGMSPVQYAAANGEIAIARALVDAGCDLTTRDNTFHEKTALEWAEMHGHAEVVALLKSATPEDTKKGCVIA